MISQNTDYSARLKELFSERVLDDYPRFKDCRTTLYQFIGEIIDENGAVSDRAINEALCRVCVNGNSLRANMREEFKEGILEEFGLRAIVAYKAFREGLGERASSMIKFRQEYRTGFNGRQLIFFKDEDGLKKFVAEKTTLEGRFHNVWI